MEVFEKGEYSKVRLIDGSNWIVFTAQYHLEKKTDNIEVQAIEIFDSKEFEFLFWNGIELSIPKSQTKKISIPQGSILLFFEGEYESVVLK